MAMQIGAVFSKILILVGAGCIGEFVFQYIKLSEGLRKLQVRRLAMKIQQLGYNCQITVGNMTSLLIPAATLGALGCRCMWGKDFSLSDLMCVTKRNMANAVSNFTKYLEHVTEALAATKRHLRHRIENLNDKMLKQNEHVAGVQKSLSDINFDLRQMQNIVSGLDGKISSLEHKQELANVGLLYLCNFVDGKKEKIPEALKFGIFPFNPC